MAKEFSLPVVLKLQDDCDNGTTLKMCGAACAQMVLHDIDDKRVYRQDEQRDLFSSIQSKASSATATWYNPPQGIKRVLNANRPPARRADRGPAKLGAGIQAVLGPIPSNLARTYKFGIVGGAHGKKPGIPWAVGREIEQINLFSRLLIRTLAVTGAAPIVAVRNNMHWIVVNGFQYEDSEIKAIMIRNPLGRYPRQRTITCDWLSDPERGKIHGEEDLCQVCPYDVVAYKTWVTEYMYRGSAGSLVAVCDRSGLVDSEILAQLGALESEAAGVISSHLGAAERKDHRTPAPVTRDQAVLLAQRAITDFNLGRLNQSVSSEAIQRPVRVKRLGRWDGDYFLVPVGQGNRISALIRISTAGDFKEASVWPNGHYIAPFGQHPEFDRLTSGEDSSLRGRQIRLTADGETGTIVSVKQHPTNPLVQEPYSAFRLSHNLVLTVKRNRAQGRPAQAHDAQERDLQISQRFSDGDPCLPTDQNAALSPPSVDEQVQLGQCIKQEAEQRGIKIADLFIGIDEPGNTVLVTYQSTETEITVKGELDKMVNIVCQCMKALPAAGWRFRIEAYGPYKLGGGEDAPLSSRPASGGGPDGIPVSSCS